MTYLRIEFLARRYQATPWEHHVNEGLVEWPPSPWRILRALLATGYAKLGWNNGEPPSSAATLIELLCTNLPAYSAPHVTQAHTRHYMPLGEHDNGDPKTTKIFDTFAYLTDPKSFLWIHWPIQLPSREFAMLEELASHMGYLGRAESWVEARAFVECPSGVVFNAVPADRADFSSGDLVELLSTDSPSDYLAWRNAALEGALMQLGNAGKKLSAKQRANLLARFPKTIVDALCTDTATIQQHGWNRAPGARWAHYRVQAPTPPRPERHRQSASEARSFVMLALFSDTERGHVRPMLPRAFEIGLLAHRAVIGRAHHLGLEVTPEIRGRTKGQLSQGHQHVHYLPLDLDDDDRIDHLLAWCPAGFSASSQEALYALPHLYDPDTELRLFTSSVAEGDRESLRTQLANVLLVRRSHTWASWTPFVCPRYIKARGANTVEGQVRAELEARGLPPAERIEVWSEDQVRAKRFYRFDRVRPRRPPPVSRPFGITLHFREEVSGPLALGYGSHYGLGLLVPSTSRH